MSLAADPAPSASALRLVVAAEELFARDGVEGVSLRQIATAAGSANNSAVHYHFGSKDGLIRAIFQHRLPQLLAERRLLVARCDLDDLRSRLEAHFLPVLALAEDPGNHYVSFVEQVQRHERGSARAHLDLPPDGQASSDELRADLERLLADLPEPLRSLRIEQAQTMAVHAAADRERAVDAGVVAVPFDVFANALFDGLTGFLRAEPSPATLQRLDAGTGVDEPPGRPRLL